MTNLWESGNDEVKLMTAGGFTVGDLVFNNGKRSRYKGQGGIVTDVRLVSRKGEECDYSISVRYDNGWETHPHTILQNITPPKEHFNDEDFKI